MLSLVLFLSVNSLIDELLDVDLVKPIFYEDTNCTIMTLVLLHSEQFILLCFLIYLFNLPLNIIFIISYISFGKMFISKSPRGSMTGESETDHAPGQR